MDLQGPEDSSAIKIRGKEGEEPICKLKNYNFQPEHLFSSSTWWRLLKVQNYHEFSLRGRFLFCLPQADEKVVDGGLLPDANGTDPNPGGQTDGSKWQKPRFSRKSLMKCCLVKWIIASTTQQGPGTGTS